MQNTGLIRIGSHTKTHLRLDDKVSYVELEDEVHGSRQRIVDELGIAPRLFCYPNGNYCQNALRVVRESYEGGVTTLRGWNRVGDDPFLLNRIGLHNDVAKDTISLLGRISGVG